MLAPSYLQGFSGDPMQLSWKRGFLRVWAVPAIIWVTFFGWREYSIQRWWAAPSSGECWDRLAKWPDGKPFGPWDDFSDFSPGSAETAEADRWRELVRQRLNHRNLCNKLFHAGDDHARLVAW
jgi:hypothetical protein